MNAMRAIRLLAVLVLLVSFHRAAAAHKTVPYLFEVAHGPALQLDVPADWQRLSTRASPTFPTLIFGPESGAEFRVLVTPHWHSYASLAPLDQAELERLIARVLNDPVRQQRTDIQRFDFRALHSTGRYVTHIERVRGPVEFKYRASGIALSGRFVIHFMVLMNEGPSGLVDETLRMIRGATDEVSPYKAPPANAVRMRWYEWFDEHGASHCAEAKIVLPEAPDATMFEKVVLGQARRFHRVPIANTNKVAEFPADGFRLEAVDADRGWYYFSKGPLGPSLSIEIEPALGGYDSESLGVKLAMALHLDPKDDRVKPTVHSWPERFIVEYLFPDIGRYRRNEGHLVTSTLVDGMDVVFHYSKLNHRAGDYREFDSLVRGTKVVVERSAIQR